MREPRTQPKRRAAIGSLGPLVVASLAAVLIGACDSSPTITFDEPLLFTGELQQAASQIHEFTLDDSGVVELEVVDLAVTPADPAAPLPVTPRIGIGLGRPTTDGCRTTYRVSAVLGDRLSFGLSAVVYCLRLFDPGTLLEGDTMRYGISVS